MKAPAGHSGGGGTSSRPSFAWPKQTALAPCQSWKIQLAWAGVPEDPRVALTPTHRPMHCRRQCDVSTHCEAGRGSTAVPTDTGRLQPGRTVP